MRGQRDSGDQGNRATAPLNLVSPSGYPQEHQTSPQPTSYPHSLGSTAWPVLSTTCVSPCLSTWPPGPPATHAHCTPTKAARPSLSPPGPLPQVGGFSGTWPPCWSPLCSCSSKPWKGL